MSGPVVTVTQADREAYNCLMQDEGYDHEPAGAWHFARHRTATEAAFREREAGLVEALERLLAVASHGSPRADDRVKQWVGAVLHARALLARAKATSEGGEGLCDADEAVAHALNERDVWADLDDRFRANSE